MSAPAARLTFSQFIDFLLVRLYELEATTGVRAGVLFDLNTIAEDLLEKLPPSWIFDAGKVLESRGLVQAIFTMGGGCHARLTGEGRLYVEEHRNSGFISEYMTNPARFRATPAADEALTSGIHSDSVSPSDVLRRERAQAFRVLTSLKDALRRDPTLTDTQRDDLLEDAETIERQLKRRDPNRAVLAALLEPFAKLTSTAGFAADLVQWFNQ